jgi:hypothetical protein
MQLLPPDAKQNCAACPQFTAISSWAGEIHPAEKANLAG